MLTPVTAVATAVMNASVKAGCTTLGGDDTSLTLVSCKLHKRRTSIRYFNINAELPVPSDGSATIAKSTELDEPNWSDDIGTTYCPAGHGLLKLNATYTY